jgi:hypothetical protein
MHPADGPCSWGPRQQFPAEAFLCIKTRILRSLGVPVIGGGCPLVFEAASPRLSGTRRGMWLFVPFKVPLWLKDYNRVDSNDVNRPWAVSSERGRLWSLDIAVLLPVPIPAHLPDLPHAPDETSNQTKANALEMTAPMDL